MQTFEFSMTDRLPAYYKMWCCIFDSAELLSDSSQTVSRTTFATAAPTAVNGESTVHPTWLPPATDHANSISSKSSDQTHPHRTKIIKEAELKLVDYFVSTNSWSCCCVSQTIFRWQKLFCLYMRSKTQAKWVRVFQILAAPLTKA